MMQLAIASSLFWFSQLPSQNHHLYCFSLLGFVFGNLFLTWILRWRYSILGFNYFVKSWYKNINFSNANIAWIYLNSAYLLGFMSFIAVRVLIQISIKRNSLWSYAWTIICLFKIHKKCWYFFKRCLTY